MKLYENHLGTFANSSHHRTAPAPVSQLFSQSVNRKESVNAVTFMAMMMMIKQMMMEGAIAYVVSGKLQHHFEIFFLMKIVKCAGAGRNGFAGVNYASML